MAYLVETRGLHGEPVRILVREDGSRLFVPDSLLPLMRDVLPFEDDEIPNPEFKQAFSQFLQEKGFIHERRVERSPLWIDQGED